MRHPPIITIRTPFKCLWMRIRPLGVVPGIKARSINTVHQSLWNLLRNLLVRKNLLKKKSPLVLRKKSPLRRGELHLQNPH